jgi:hypothetical protein
MTIRQTDRWALELRVAAEDISCCPHCRDTLERAADRIEIVRDRFEQIDTCPPLLALEHWQRIRDMKVPGPID